jgi:photosystem II stability/assembly factor-like uncharacterized protein
MHHFLQFSLSSSKRFAIALLVSFCTPWTGSAQSPLELVSPKQPLPASSLETVRGNPSGLILAAGQLGTILRSTDAGATWSAITTGTSAWLFGLAIPPGERCIAVGTPGAILTSSDRGASWTKRTAPFNGTFLAVEWLAEDIAIAAGQGGILIKTTDAGVNWAMMPTNLGWHAESLQFLDPSKNGVWWERSDSSSAQAMEDGRG